ncbi:hypothetical protein [Longimicrobium sp.]|uniref:hypothetical protein n=1 Tax=Longimicrobium sp. TaxID=2029185 RepID=UPI002E33BE21|nr:hypothetical protein [Longimicrobium sp.]HEX6038967.1 hypothetical protein [Longimicrobium sp.]
MADDGRDAGIRVERREEDERPGHGAPGMDVRDEDLEPHAGLRYIARMFKILAILLILLLIAEMVLGLVQQGQAAIPQLLIEATRLIVFAGLLWGAADMGLMLIESNHDLRATRILVGRLNNRVQRLEQIAMTGSPRGGTGPQLPPTSPGGERRERPR